MKWIMGTRGSALALAQSMQVKKLLEQQYADLEIEVKIIRTTGDRRVDVALDKLNDKGVFVKDIEEELLDKRIDLAVHSMKDMPSQVDERLCFTRTLLREDARDVLILNKKTSLAELDKNARIATGSARRARQLLALRPDLEICGIRGNIETRIRRMKEEGLDGIVLAAAGLHRLHMEELITMYFDEEDMVPACGQGALAIEVRCADEEIQQRINALSQVSIDMEVMVERELLRCIQAGCHTPFGVRAHVKGNQIALRAMYANIAGTKLAHVHRVFDAAKTEQEIKRIAEDLRAQVEEVL